MLRCRCALVALLLAASVARAQQASNLAGFHRGGQSFLTWTESAGVAGETYRVYRATFAITSANLASATLVATVPEGSGFYRREADRTDPPSGFDQRFHILNDLGAPLAAGTGLFVWTSHETGSYFYAVTLVLGGTENRAISSANALSTGLSESEAAARPVQVWQSAGGRGRLYTQWMDYARWNPTFEGYAYNYEVTVPPAYDGTTSLPLVIYLHGWANDGGYELQPETPWDWPVAQILIDDRYHTWYYGFSSTYDFTLGAEADTGPVENYTEQRILRAIREVQAMSWLRIDPRRIYVFGSSMGGSGAITLGMRYPDVFAAAYGGLPMTDYQTSPDGGIDWVADIAPKWGTPAANLATLNRGADAAHLARYDGTPVWTWMNHLQQLRNRAGDEMAYLQSSHGSLDDVISWTSQGRPFYGALYDGRRGFAGMVVNEGHSWPGFIEATATTQFDQWQFRRDRSFPALTNASNSSPVPPGATARYNVDIEWSCPWNAFAGDLVDTDARWEVVLRSTTVDQTADVTPRRLQALRIADGDSFTWRNVRISDGVTVQSGAVSAGALRLVTVPAFQITRGGNRLVLDRSGSGGGGGGGGTPTPPGRSAIVVGGDAGSGGRWEVRSGSASSYASVGTSTLRWAAYDAAAGDVRPATGDLDGDGRLERVFGIGRYAPSGGWMAVHDDDGTMLRWLRIPWSAYNAANGEVFPACGDVDGDGRAEIVAAIGTYTTSGGWAALFDDAVAGYARMRWLRVPWAAYNAANGAVHPACGELDGDGFAEVVLGLGTFPSNGGWQVVLGGSNRSYVRLRWTRVPFTAFTAAGGETWPACGDLDGDGREELAIGLGVGGQGRVEFRDDLGASLAHQAWGAVPWAEYASARGETRPCCADVDGDGREETVVALGPGGQSSLAVFEDAAGSRAFREWVRLDWGGYTTTTGSHRVARDVALTRAAAGRAWPDTSNGVHLFADQLPDDLNDAQAMYVTSRFAGTQKQTTSQLARLRAMNPGFLCLHYQLLTGAGDIEFVDGDTWRSDWTDVSSNLGWFYTDPTSPWPNRWIRQMDWNWYLARLDSGWREYWIAEAIRRMGTQNDGVFADSASEPWNMSPEPSWLQAPQLYEYGDLVNAFHAAAWPRLRAAGKVYLPNLGAHVTTSTRLTTENMDGFMIEDLGKWSGTGDFFGEADWRLQMDRVLPSVARDRIVIGQSYFESVANVEERSFCLATYLLMKGRRSYLNFLADGAGMVQFFPEFDLPIGTPIESSTTSEGLRDAASGLYRRRFTNGLAVVNPTDQARLMDLGETLFLATPSGGGEIPASGIPTGTILYAPVTRVTLPPNSAAILIRTR